MIKELKYLETLEFNAKLNIASSLRVAVNVLEQDENVQVLIKEADSYLQAEIALTLLQCLDAKIELDQEHPHDSSMAAYLYILSKTNLGMAILCAIHVKQGRSCFWSKKFADQLIEAYYLNFANRKLE